MLRRTHPLGLQARHSYEELVRYIETDPTKIKFPDRAASYRRKHPFMTQDDGSKAALMEQKRVIDYRLGDDHAPYQPERRDVEAPTPVDTFYDPAESIQDMFVRSRPLPLGPSQAPDTEQNALTAEGFNPPSILDRLTSRVGDNATQGALNAVAQYGQDAAAGALGWVGRTIADGARIQADFYMNELPAMIRDRAIYPALDPNRYLAPRPGSVGIASPTTDAQLGATRRRTIGFTRRTPDHWRGF